MLFSQNTRLTNQKTEEISNKKTTQIQKGNVRNEKRKKVTEMYVMKKKQKKKHLHPSILKACEKLHFIVLIYIHTNKTNNINTYILLYRRHGQTDKHRNP